MKRGFIGETLAIARTEIWRLFRKGRSYIGFGAVSFIIIVIQIALVIDGEPYLNVGLQTLRESFVFNGNLLNGYLSVYLILTGLWVHVPFLIALVTGDLVAGEASAGTLRLLLTRPVRRSALLAGKFCAAVFYVLMMILTMSILSLGLGYLTLGTGDLMVMRDTIYIFPEDDVLWRFISAFGFSILSMTTVAALTFMFSTFADNGVTPIIITMSIIIAFLILSAIDLSLFRAIKPFMFTSYMGTWKEFFTDPVDKIKIAKAAGVLFLHIITFYSLAWYHFTRKDILS
jgi:ABC-2 type transport system permease protein